MTGPTPQGRPQNDLELLSEVLHVIGKNADVIERLVVTPMRAGRESDVQLQLETARLQLERVREEAKLQRAVESEVTKRVVAKGRMTVVAVLVIVAGAVVVVYLLRHTAFDFGAAGKVASNGLVIPAATSIGLVAAVVRVVKAIRKRRASRNPALTAMLELVQPESDDGGTPEVKKEK